jgi:hypothetical protein
MVAQQPSIADWSIGDPRALARGWQSLRSPWEADEPTANNVAPIASLNLAGR